MSKASTWSLFSILVVLFLVVLHLIYPPSTKAAAGDVLNGYAWSSNIGWISLNCNQPAWGASPASNTCSTSDYKVAMDLATGNFSGYAWSSNLGWIDFAPAGGYPAAPNNGAKLIAVPVSTCASGKEASGWIRVLSNGSGWDGWIKMAGSTTGGDHYGTCLNSDGKSLGGANGATDSGYAWGGDVVGWMQFDPAWKKVIKKSNIIEIPPM